jgi:hypothetical protein
LERHLGRLTDQLHWPLWRRRPHSRPSRHRHLVVLLNKTGGANLDAMFAGIADIL